jgi:hypothetical protein
MKTFGNRVVVMIVTSMLLAVSLTFSAAARRANLETDFEASNAPRQSVASKAPAAPTLTSIYTDLNRQCRTLEKPTATFNGLVRRCPGVAGYKLLVVWGDERVDMFVVTPRGREFDLDFRHFITGTESDPFSDPGTRAEWRVKREHGKVVPVAIVVRVIAQESAPVNTVTSYLAVSKITKNEICVTDKVLPGPKQNEEARRAADVAVNKPCLKARE